MSETRLGGDFGPEYVCTSGEDAIYMLESIGRTDLDGGSLMILPANPDSLGDGFREVWHSEHSVPWDWARYTKLDRFFD